MFGRSPRGYDWGDRPALPAALRLLNYAKAGCWRPARDSFVAKREESSRWRSGGPAIPPITVARLRLVVLLGLLTPLFATVQWLVVGEATPRTAVELVPEIVEVPVEVEVTLERVVERVVYVPDPDEAATSEPPAEAVSSPGTAPSAGTPPGTSAPVTSVTPTSR